MNVKDGMKLAAAAIGTAVTGRPVVHVSRKVLPMRAEFKHLEALKFTTRLVYDQQGRCVEEVKVLAGRLPPGGPRFFLCCNVEISIGNHKRRIQLGNAIQAANLDEAFRNFDSTFKAACDEAQKNADAEVDKFMAEKAAAEKPHPYSAEANPDAPKVNQPIVDLRIENKKE